MTPVTGITFGSCLFLMFFCVRSMDNGDPKIGGIYSIESKRGTSEESQTGEFVNPANLQGNYEEYPMIVPKRAALLLDRLMVALHHALEEEQRNGRRRIGDFYGEDRTPSFILKGGSLADFDPTENDFMYSDEEVPDFDLKTLRDLKSANRGSGETLMAKSFQRRTPNDEDSISGRNNGRKYWRCYFNAVSCF